MTALSSSESMHISVELLDAFWFMRPMSLEEIEFVSRHLSDCDACRLRAAKFRELFPDRKDPDIPAKSGLSNSD